MQPADPAKIAVLRANAIGDFVYTLPALAALRDRFPSSEIVLLGKPWHAEFLSARPSPVDRVIALPPIAGVGAPEDYCTNSGDRAAITTALREERFDLAVQLHGGGRHSNRFVREIEPRWSIGLRAPDAVELDQWVSYQYWQPEILRMLEVVALGGARPVTLTPVLDVTESDRADARAVAPADPRELVLVHPGAGDPRRRWPVERFRELTERILASGLPVAIAGGAGEDERLAAELHASLNGPVLDLSGKLSLGAFVGLAAECRLFVGNDSGPLHIAEAVGAPTVGIYWCGNTINADPMTRHLHRTVLSWRLQCGDCGANILDGPCGHSSSVADRASVDEVLAQCRDLLALDVRPLAPAPVS